MFALGLASACGWPDGLPSDSSYSDDSASGSDGTTTTTTTSLESTVTSDGGTTGDGHTGPTPDPTGFIEDPDGGPRPYECDMWKDDCPRGEKCMPWANDGGHAWNSTRCTPLARDPNEPGEPCTVVESAVSGIDDCVAGAMCFYVDERTNTGECVAFCTGTKPAPYCEDPNTYCNIDAVGLMILCLPLCDPLVQDCPAGAGCYPQFDRFECWPDSSESDGVAGDPCEYFNVCDPSLFCAPGNAIPGCPASGCCSPFCDVTATDPPCAAGLYCIPWYGEGQAPKGFEDLGGCMVPAGE